MSQMHFEGFRIKHIASEPSSLVSELTLREGHLMLSLLAFSNRPRNEVASAFRRKARHRLGRVQSSHHLSSRTRLDFTYMPKPDGVGRHLCQNQSFAEISQSTLRSIFCSTNSVCGSQPRHKPRC